MLRHACGFKLANDGQDTRALQHYLGHKNIQHTVRYTELTTERFRDFWKDEELGCEMRRALASEGAATNGRTGRGLRDADKRQIQILANEASDSADDQLLPIPWQKPPAKKSR